jgi:hypothetical protein
LDLSKGESLVNNDIMDLLADEEHRSQQDYWETIRAEYHFADSMPELREVGGVAALLRY